MIQSTILLLFVTMIWGMGFIGTKWTLADYSPLWSNSIRFAIAGMLCMPFLIYFKSYKLSKEKLMGVWYASLFLLSGMLLQTYGLAYTSVAKSGFITALYSLFIPVICMLFYKKRFNAAFWALLTVSLMGIALMGELKMSKFNLGDLLTALCAIGFALHFLAIEKITKNFRSAFELNALQCFFVGIIGIPVALFIDGPVSLSPLLEIKSITEPSTLLGFLSVSVFSSIIAFTGLAFAQKKIPAHIVGLFCLLESAFAAAFGYIFLSEDMSMTQIMGGALVLTSVALLPIAESASLRRKVIRKLSFAKR